MSYNYTLKYRTFNQMLDDVLVDFTNYSLEGMIEPQQLIKVAKRVNYDLGLRIMMTKQAVLDVEKGRVKLPDDFYVLNFALVCDEHTVHSAIPSGTHTEERRIDPVITPYQIPSNEVISACTDGTVNCGTCGSCSPCGCNPAPTSPCVTTTDICVKPRVILNCKNECYEIVQIVNTISTTYKRTFPIQILENPESVDCNCPNISMRCPNKAWIQNGFLQTNLDCAKIYINYQGALEDDNGNLLVPDHDMLNEYYEYATKQRILENLMMNDEPVGQKIQVVEARLRAARNNALSIVNTPNFSEMKRVWEMNRKAMYARYYNQFKSYEVYYGPLTNGY